MKNCLLALFLHMPQAHIYTCLYIQLCNVCVMPSQAEIVGFHFFPLLCVAYFSSSMLFAICLLLSTSFFCFFFFAHSFSRTKVGLGQGHLPLAKQIGIIATAANKRRGSPRKLAASSSQHSKM